MKVTVCQLHDERDLFPDDWQRLAAHVQRERSDLVLLPEMPFCGWPFAKRTFEYGVWQAAVHAHNEWEARLGDLASAVVLGTRPIDFGNQRYDEGFAWDRANGLRSVHAQAYAPNQKGDWEGSWYNSATPNFEPITIDVAQSDESISVGFLIGNELQLTEQARIYGLEGVHCIVTPRATGLDIERWLVRGREAAVAADTFCMSSNRIDVADRFGGCGWIIAPDGEVLAMTSEAHPIASAAIEIELAGKHRGTQVRSTTNVSATRLGS